MHSTAEKSKVQGKEGFFLESWSPPLEHVAATPEVETAVLASSLLKETVLLIN